MSIPFAFNNFHPSGSEKAMSSACVYALLYISVLSLSILLYLNLRSVNACSCLTGSVIVSFICFS